MSTGIDDDALIESVLDKQAARGGQTATTKGPKMSSNRKDMVKGQKGKLIPAITQNEADSVTEFKKQQEWWAKWKLRNGKQGYAAEEIKAEGDKLKLDEDLIKQRNLNDDRLIKQMQVEDKNSGRGVAQFTNGETVVLKKPEEVKDLEQGEGQEILSERIKGTHGEVGKGEEGDQDVDNKG